MIDKTRFPELFALQAERNFRANKFRELRKKAAEMYDAGSGWTVNKWEWQKEICAALGYRRGVKLIRVRKDIIRQYVKDCYRFAQSSWASHDTEYYSACGYDDAQAEKRYYYGKLAKALHKEWKVYFFQK